jgi:hypothetical protein
MKPAAITGVVLSLASGAIATARADTAGPLSEQAGAAFARGDLAAAAVLYGRARGAAPKDVAPARGACRVALRQRREAEARVFCQRAFMLGGIPEDLRNVVAATMGVATPPATTELVSASLLADAAVRQAPAEPWGYLARCDIARRLGRRDALHACMADLQRVAPQHAATRQLFATVSQRAPLWAWLGRFALLVALAATLGHAVLRRLRARGRRGGAVSMGAAAAAVAALAAVALGSAAARAEPQPGSDRLSNYPIDERHPEASIPSPAEQSKNPLEFGYLLQDMLAKAAEAAQSRDWRAAARYYDALIKAVPGRSYAYGKACEAYQALDERDKALVRCREALVHEGVTINDFSHYVTLVLAQKQPLNDGQRKELGVVVDHLARQPEAASVAAHRLRCDVAVRLRDVPALEQCTKALAAATPATDPLTISFQWALAVEKNDHAQAWRLIDRARRAGMKKDGVARMEQMTARSVRGRSLRLAFLALGATILCALAAVGMRRLAASRRGVAV